MFAFKCDRCGKLYERSDKPYRNICDRLELNRCIDGKRGAKVDLCRECMSELESWFYDEVPEHIVKELEARGLI